jgi:hypothetical protein
MKLRINKYWFIFSVVKILYMFFALFIYVRFTSLGDTNRYLMGKTYGSSNWFRNSTEMMDVLAHSFSIFLGPVLANLPFVFLSLFGIFYAVRRLNLSNNELVPLLIILSFPSFGIWTSVASKESVTVFYLGIILGFIIDLSKDKKMKNHILVILSFYLCYLFKPQYLIAISGLIIFLYICRWIKLSGFGKLILLLIFFIFSFLVLYINRDIINELSFVMPLHFSFESNSTRENTIWINDYDVFWNAPYGVFIGFFGPTFYEALSKISHLFAFIESCLILIVFFYGILRLLLISMITQKFNIYFFSVFIIATIWILFVHYPFGVLNPGSAIRYREGFFAFVVILFYFGYVEVTRRYRYSSDKPNISRN